MPDSGLKRPSRYAGGARLVGNFIMRVTGIPVPKAQPKKAVLDLPFPYVARVTATRSQQRLYDYRKELFESPARGTLPFLVRFTQWDDSPADAMVWMPLESFCVLLKAHYDSIMEGTENAPPSNHG